MKRYYILVFLIFIITIRLFAEPPVIELQTEALSSIRGKSAESYWFDGINVYQTSAGGTICENVNTFHEKSFNSEKELKTILGTYGDSFLVSRKKEPTDQSRQWAYKNNYIDIYIYNPEDESYQLLDKIAGGTIKSDIKWLFHYYDEYYIGSRSRDGTYDYVNQVLINSLTGEEIAQYGAPLVDLSPDKLTGLYYSFLEKYTVRKPGVKNSDIGNYTEILGNNRNSFYVTNDLFALQFGEELRIYNLECELRVTFKYLIPEGSGLNPIHFKKFRTSEYGYFGTPYTLVKAPDIYPYLDELGLLFHPTTAVLNDDRVWVREWPLLDAKHLAFLEQGEEVEVLDRSGIKVKIDDMNDYWYKIKRSDGTEGWAYGYFLDLAEE